MTDHSTKAITGDSEKLKEIRDKFGGIPVVTFEVLARQENTPMGWNKMILVPASSDFEFTPEGEKEISELAETISVEIGKILDKEAERHSDA